MSDRKRYADLRKRANRLGLHLTLILMDGPSPEEGEVRDIGPIQWSGEKSDDLRAHLAFLDGILAAKADGRR